MVTSASHLWHAVFWLCVCMCERESVFCMCACLCVCVRWLSALLFMPTWVETPSQPSSKCSQIPKHPKDASLIFFFYCKSTVFKVVSWSSQQYVLAHLCGLFPYSPKVYDTVHISSNLSNLPPHPSLKTTLLWAVICWVWGMQMNPGVLFCPLCALVCIVHNPVRLRLTLYNSIH